MKNLVLDTAVGYEYDPGRKIDFTNLYINSFIVLFTFGMFSDMILIYSVVGVVKISVVFLVEEKLRNAHKKSR